MYDNFMIFLIELVNIIVMVMMRSPGTTESYNYILQSRSFKTIDILEKKTLIKYKSNFVFG